MSSSSRQQDLIEMEMQPSASRPRLPSGDMESLRTPPVLVVSPSEPEPVCSRAPSPSEGTHDERRASREPLLLFNRSRSPSQSNWSSEERNSAARSPPSRANGATIQQEIDSDSTRGEAKPITRTGWQRIFTGWLVHLPALALTVALVALTKQPRFWYPEEGIKRSPGDRKAAINAETINNILQLPAKIHELLIIASLSSVAVAMFRRRLIREGVRLGFLTGGYRLGDLPYLGTAAFWRQGVSPSQPWEVLLAGFVAFGTLMSTVVGPASAVLLVPTLGWYPLEHGAAFHDIRLPLFYFRNPHNIWPTELAGGVNPFDDMGHCKVMEGFYQPWCPAGGFSEIWAWAQSFGASDLSDTLKFQFPPTKLRRELVFTNISEPALNVPITLCTTPSHFLMVSIGLLRDYIDYNSSVGEIARAPYRLTTEPSTTPRFKVPQHLLQPFVQSRCELYPKDQVKATESEQSMRFPVEGLNCFQNDDCLAAQKDPELIHWEEQPWFGSVAEEARHRSASTRFFTAGDKSPFLYLLGQLPEADGKHFVYACGFAASWVASDYTTDPNVGDVLNSTLGSVQNMTRTFFEKNLENVHGKTMTFNRSILDYLVPRPDEREATGTALSRIVHRFAEPCDGPSKNKSGFRCVAPVNITNEDATRVFLSKFFGIYLTDALARTNARASTYLNLMQTEDDKNLTIVDLNKQFGSRAGPLYYQTINETHSVRFKKTDPEPEVLNFTVKEFIDEEGFGLSLPIDFAIERYGYGSGEARKTLEWARAMMYIYLAIVAIYASAVGTQHVVESFGGSRADRRTRVLSIIPWSDLQGLIILALKTPPPANGGLADSGAGITCDKTWETMVRARSDDKQNVLLVFDGTEGTKELDNTGEETYY